MKWPARRVPGVALAVTVVVAEVVGLPGAGRHDHRDPVLPEVLRRDDERRVADPAAGRGQLGEVEAGRPVADRRCASTPPAAIRPSETGAVTGMPRICLSPTVFRHSGPTWKTWSRTLAESGREAQLRVRAGPVALSREERLDRERVVLAGVEPLRGGAFEVAPWIVDDRVEPAWPGSGGRRAARPSGAGPRGARGRVRRAARRVDMWGLCAHDPTVDPAANRLPHGAPTARSRPRRGHLIDPRKTAAGGSALRCVAVCRRCSAHRWRTVIRPVGVPFGATATLRVP